MSRLESHPVAALFPLLADDEIRDLSADVKANGLRLAITLFEGKILDGRNRVRACELAGVEPRFETFEGDETEALRYAISVNLHRRHLDDAQRKMVAARATKFFAAEASDRMRAGKPALDSEQGRAAAKAAKVLNVSTSGVYEAAKIQRAGAPELVAAVDRGAVAVSTAATIAETPHEEQRRLVAGSEREILAAARAIRERLAAERRAERLERLRKLSGRCEPLSSVPGRFAVILADPPWEYEDDGCRGAAAGHYPPMSLSAICALAPQVADRALEDAALFFWTTAPKLEEAFAVLRAWGFVYKTGVVWDKVLLGLGHYVRGRHEHLLIATRGSPPTPEPANRPPSIVSAPRREHSRKPDEVYEVIERMYPNLPRLELFARGGRHGWVVWGNEAGPIESRAAAVGGRSR